MEPILWKLPPEILSLILGEVVRGMSLGETLPWVKLFSLAIPEEAVWRAVTGSLYLHALPSLGALFEPRKVWRKEIHSYWESFIIVQETSHLYLFIDHEGHETRVTSLFPPVFNDKFCLIVTIRGPAVLATKNRLLYTVFEIKCKNIYTCSLVHASEGWLVTVSLLDTNTIKIYRVPESSEDSVEIPISNIGPFLNIGKCAYYARDFRKEVKGLYMGEGYRGFYTPQGIFSYSNGDLIEKATPSEEMLMANPKHMKQVWYVSSRRGMDIIMTFNTLFFCKIVEGNLAIIWSAPASELNTFDTCVLDHYIALGNKVFDIQTGDVLFTSSNKIAGLTRKEEVGFYIWEFHP